MNTVPFPIIIDKINNSKSRTLVFYHKNCTDGFGAAYAHYVKTKEIPGYSADRNIYIPITYVKRKEESPEEIVDKILSNPSLCDIEYSEADSDVIILDFSFDPDVFHAMAGRFRSIIMIDHHRTAIEKYLTVGIQPGITRMKNYLIIFDEKHSGAYLTYMHSYRFISIDLKDTVPDSAVPLLYKYISDRDLWEFKYEATDNFIEALSGMYDRDFKTWDSLDLYNPNTIIKLCETGKSLILKRDMDCVKLSGNGMNVNISIINNYEVKTYRVYLINTIPQLASSLGNKIIETMNRDIVALWHMTNKGEIAVSLRSRKGVDITPIAVFFGGGGHESAAGFSLSLDDFTSYILNGNLCLRKNNIL